MTASYPKITSHTAYHPLSQNFFESYSPYVLVNSPEDANLVLSTGCEPRYLLVLDADGPPGSKSLKSNDIEEFRGRVGIVIYILPLDADLSIAASRILELLEIDGTAIGFATPQQLTQWKQACLQCAKEQKTEDTQGQEQDGIALEWSTNEMMGGDWMQWAVVKKAPEWAFC